MTLAIAMEQFRCKVQARIVTSSSSETFELKNGASRMQNTLCGRDCVAQRNTHENLQGGLALSLLQCYRI